MELVDEFFRADASFCRIDLYGSAVRIRRTHVDHVLPDEAKKSHVDIGLNVFDEVPQVYVAVGVGEGTRDQKLWQRSLLFCVGPL